MFNLEEMKSGDICTICWMLGDLGTFLKERLKLDIDDTIQIISNDGYELIIRSNNNTYALDSFSAHAIKVYA